MIEDLRADRDAWMEQANVESAQWSVMRAERDALRAEIEELVAHIDGWPRDHVYVLRSELLRNLRGILAGTADQNDDLTGQPAHR